MMEIRCRSIRVEFLEGSGLRSETHKVVFKVPYYLKPMKTVLARYCKIDMSKKWVLEASFYGGKKFVFSNK